MYVFVCLRQMSSLKSLKFQKSQVKNVDDIERVEKISKDIQKKSETLANGGESTPYITKGKDRLIDA